MDNNACKELQYIHAQQTHRLLQTNWKDKNTAILYREHYTADMTRSPMDAVDKDTAPPPWLTVLVTFSLIFCMCDRLKCLQLVKTVISINAKEAQPNDEPNQKPSSNITYIFSCDSAGQACCTMALTELQYSEKQKPYLQTGYACIIRKRQQNGIPVNQCRPAHGKLIWSKCLPCQFQMATQCERYSIGHWCKYNCLHDSNMQLGYFVLLSAFILPGWIFKF